MTTCEQDPRSRQAGTGPERAALGRRAAVLGQAAGRDPVDARSNRFGERTGPGGCAPGGNGVVSTGGTAARQHRASGDRSMGPTRGGRTGQKLHRPSASGPDGAEPGPPARLSRVRDAAPGDVLFSRHRTPSGRHRVGPPLIRQLHRRFRAGGWTAATGNRSMPRAGPVRSEFRPDDPASVRLERGTTPPRQRHRIGVHRLRERQRSRPVAGLPVPGITRWPRCWVEITLKASYCHREHRLRHHIPFFDRHGTER